MSNGDEDHLQEQETPRCRVFTEMQSGAEMQFWNQKDCISSPWHASWHGAEALYSLVFMVKTETKYHTFYLFPWLPPYSRWRQSASPAAPSCKRQVGEGSHWGSITQARQIALCLVFSITASERTQICFEGLWGRFSGTVYLITKVAPLIKINDNLKYTINAAVLIKHTMRSIQLYYVMHTIYSWHGRPDHAANDEWNGLKQLSDGVTWIQTRGKSNANEPWVFSLSTETIPMWLWMCGLPAAMCTISSSLSLSPSPHFSSFFFLPQAHKDAKETGSISALLGAYRIIMEIRTQQYVWYSPSLVPWCLKNK